MGVELPKLRNYNLDSNVGRVFLILDASRNILDSTSRKAISEHNPSTILNRIIVILQVIIINELKKMSDYNYIPWKYR